MNSRMATVAATFATAVAALAAAVPMHALAQAFPNRPVRMIVPFPPGGPADLAARALAPAMQSRLGQPVVVENRAGAGGTLGVGLVAKAEPDGYSTVLSGPGALVAAPFMMANFPYDVTKELSPVTLVIRVPAAIVTGKPSGLTTVKQLIDYARANPGKISFASAGQGTLSHLVGELLKLEAGIDIVHVPYKGAAPATTDLIAGTVQLMFPDLPPALPQVQAGKLVAIAVTSPQRAASLPSVPTTTETGYPGVLLESQYGLLSTGGLPAAVLRTLNTAATEGLRQADVVAQLDKLGATASPTTPDEYRQLIATERTRWERVIKATGTKME